MEGFGCKERFNVLSLLDQLFQYEILLISLYCIYEKTNLVFFVFLHK